MQQFASRDLMVNGLPGEPVDRGGDCGTCTNCTACTDQGTNTQRINPDGATDSDYAALVDQLRGMMP